MAVVRAFTTRIFARSDAATELPAIQGQVSPSLTAKLNA
jgi:hypothetical protein